MMILLLYRQPRLAALSGTTQTVHFLFNAGHTQLYQLGNSLYEAEAAATASIATRVPRIRLSNLAKIFSEYGTNDELFLDSVYPHMVVHNTSLSSTMVGV